MKDITLKQKHVLSSDYSVYLYNVDTVTYQAFIKNDSADVDFIRLTIGVTTIVNGKRTAQITRQVIITPLQPSNEHVHIGNVNRLMATKHRMWAAFEAVKRGKKNVTVGTFVALSPPPSKWRKTVGSLTPFEIRPIDTIKTIEQAMAQERIEDENTSDI